MFDDLEFGESIGLGLGYSSFVYDLRSSEVLICHLGGGDHDKANAIGIVCDTWVGRMWESRPHPLSR